MDPNQDQTIAFLLEAGSFGETGTVDRIDTHCAVVFLIGERAYKLKRAVKFLYLDYSTTELRQQACASELRLNRRTAPEIYLEIRSINRLPDGNLTFESGGEPVDWLVVMRRFSQDDLFDTMALHQRLTPNILRDLTDHVAQFHAEAEVTPDFGGAQAMRAVIDGNLQNMALSQTILSEDMANRLTVISLATLDRVGPILDARRSSGQVRRCHGDLHLGNICLYKGEPTLFDCIEFSDEIACTDVLYDLAFLVMDLWRRELKAEANLVFNRYLDMAGDSLGIAAFPLLLSTRAALRAHVSAAASTIQPSADERLRKEADARNYLLHAIGFLSAGEPRLIAVGGLSGTGKSTLAMALAPELGVAPGARVLRSDIIRKRIRDVTPESRLPESVYTKEERERIYRGLGHRAVAALASGYAVVVDAVFTDPEERHAIAEVALNAGVKFLGLWLTAPIPVLEARLEQRHNDASDATVAILRQQLDYQIGSLADWSAIDAGGDAARTLARARLAIKA